MRLSAAAPSSPLLLWTLLLWIGRPQILAAAPSAATGAAIATSTRDFFALLQCEDVSVIQITADLKLEPQEAPDEPVIVRRNVSVSGAPFGAADNGSRLESSPESEVLAASGNTTLQLTLLDFANLYGKIQLDPAVVLTFRSLELYRTFSGASARLDFMGRSGGATVELVGVVQRRVACMPQEMGLANFRDLPRPTGQSAEAAAQQIIEDVSGPPLCWRTRPAAAAAAAEPPPPLPPPCGEGAGGGGNQTASPEAWNASGGSGSGSGSGSGNSSRRCRAPYFGMRDVAFMTQLPDYKLGTNGGYAVRYLGSAIVCDHQVDQTCVDTLGVDRCMSDLVTAYGREADGDGDGGGDGVAAPLVPSTQLAPAGDEGGGGEEGRRRQRSLELGLGVGLGCGATVLIVAAAVGLAYLRSSRRRRLRHGHRRLQDAHRSRSRSLGQLRADPESGAGLPATGVWSANAAAAASPKGSRGPLERDGGGGATAAAVMWSAGGEAACDKLRDEAAAAAAAVGLDAETVGPDSVEAVRWRLACSRKPLQVKILEPIGRGAFGRVYKGLWQGTVVAVKVLMLPATLSADERRHRMAVMEAAVSLVARHPRVVQTYCYNFQGVLSSAARNRSVALALAGRDMEAGASEPPISPHHYELQLVLEYCDLGTLREALDRGAFHPLIPPPRTPPSQLPYTPRRAAATAAPTAAAAAAALDPDSLQGLIVVTPADAPSATFPGFIPSAAAAAAGATTAASAAAVLPPIRTTAWYNVPGCKAAALGNDASCHAEAPQRSADYAASEVEDGFGAAARVPPHQAGEGEQPPEGRGGSCRALHPDSDSDTSPQALRLPAARRLQPSSQPQPQQPQQQQQRGEEQQQEGESCRTVPYRYDLMLAVAADVASGVLHLHSNGIVHGDLKASNVLLSSGTSCRTDSARTPTSPNSDIAAVAADQEAKTAAAGAAQDGGMYGATAVRHSEDSFAYVPYTSLEELSTRGGAAAAKLPFLDAVMAGQYGIGTAFTAAAAAVGGGCGGGGRSGSLHGSVVSAASTQTELPPCVVAKVGDFGLATHVDELQHGTHVSASAAQGTLTHTAPELLLHGHISKACDAYAYGILLYELFTGDRPYRGLNRALLPHQVAFQGLRPVLPPHTPPAFRALAESCWAADPRQRPSFESILAEVQRMRTEAAAAASVAATAGPARQAAAAAVVAATAAADVTGS